MDIEMSNEAESGDKRRFLRVPFESEVLLSNDRSSWSCHLLDISLKGVLITCPDNWVAELQDQFQLLLILEPSDISIRMETSVAHMEDDRVGLICQHIDIDSISHLRRLLELNAGNSEILEREISELIHYS